MHLGVSGRQVLLGCTLFPGKITSSLCGSVYSSVKWEGIHDILNRVVMRIKRQDGRKACNTVLGIQAPLRIYYLPHHMKCSAASPTSLRKTDGPCGPPRPPGHQHLLRDMHAASGGLNFIGLGWGLGTCLFLKPPTGV